MAVPCVYAIGVVCWANFGNNYEELCFFESFNCRSILAGMQSVGANNAKPCDRGVMAPEAHH